MVAVISVVLDPFLTVPDNLNMWILSFLCQGNFVLNFVVVRNIHFIILNDIIDILFHLSNTYFYTFLESSDQMLAIDEKKRG